MVDEYGSGISLDENLDMEIDSTGDIQSTDGLSELQKDIAWQSTFSLQRFLGSSPTDEVEVQALNTATLVAEADSRVDTVIPEKSTVSFVEGNKKLKVKMSYLTNAGEEQEFIYEV